MTTRRERIRTGLLLGVLALLLGVWSLVIPVFESPDEPSHWQYARYLHDHWRLPLYGPGFEEANSPPLYYAAIAPLATAMPSPVMVTATDEHGAAVSLAAPRTFLNTDRDLTRYRPVRLARMVSILMSIATVWLTFTIGVAATGRRDVGLLAALAVALLPQFTFRGTNVSNDALVMTFAAATTLGVVRLLGRGFTWSRGVWTAVALACAYLTKISAIALLVPVAYALVAADSPDAADRPTLWRRALRLSALVPAAIIVLPWTLRNISLYGDPFASAAMHTAVAHIITERSLFSRYFLRYFPTLLSKSFIGSFGWANILLPSWVYAVFAALILAAAVGLVRSWRRGTLDVRLTAALALAALSTLAIVVHINLSFTQPQGRYMFPALPALGTLAALGWASLPSPLAWLRRPMLLGALLAALNVYCLVGVAWAAYYPPPARDVAPGVRRLQPTTISGLAYSPSTRDFVVTTDDPWWIMPVEVDATEFGALELVLRASLEPQTRKGCVYFATETRELAANAPVCFTWQADGSAKQTIVPLATRPGWSGFITHLRVDIIDDGAAPARGGRIRLEGQHLVPLRR